MTLALVAAVLLAAAGSPATGDRPAPPAVMIARGADADSVLQEATLRLRPELAAAGYGSQVATCAVNPVAGPAACPRDTTLATISLARANGATSIFVTSKLRSGLELRRQVHVEANEGGGDATLLAVRAVELLRDLQLEVAQVAQDDEDPKPLELYNEPPEPKPPHWHLIGGASTLFLPWTKRSNFMPAVGGVLGLGVRIGQHVLAVADAAGPFAMQVPIGAPDSFTGPYTPRQLYQVVGRVSVRIGPRSALDGPFATFFAGGGYINVDLDSRVSSVASRHFLPTLAGFGVGYTTRITPSLVVAADVDLIGAPVLEIRDGDRHALTDSASVWIAVNLTAAFTLR